MTAALIATLVDESEHRLAVSRWRRGALKVDEAVGRVRVLGEDNLGPITRLVRLLHASKPRLVLNHSSLTHGGLTWEHEPI